MPGRNGTGPVGYGPMTGRGMGYCTGAYPSGNGAWTGNRYGRGFGYRLGCGYGRGYGYGRRNNMYYPERFSKVDERELINDEKEYLQDRLNYLNEELERLSEDNK